MIGVSLEGKGELKYYCDVIQCQESQDTYMRWRLEQDLLKWKEDLKGRKMSEQNKQSNQISNESKPPGGKRMREIRKCQKPSL